MTECECDLIGCRPCGRRFVRRTQQQYLLLLKIMIAILVLLPLIAIVWGVVL